jgi:hypothetical protein
LGVCVKCPESGGETPSGITVDGVAHLRSCEADNSDSLALFNLYAFHTVRTSKVPYIAAICKRKSAGSRLTFLVYRHTVHDLNEKRSPRSARASHPELDAHNADTYDPPKKSNGVGA